MAKIGLLQMIYGQWFIANCNDLWQIWLIANGLRQMVCCIQTSYLYQHCWDEEIFNDHAQIGEGNRDA